MTGRCDCGDPYCNSCYPGNPGPPPEGFEDCHNMDCDDPRVPMEQLTECPGCLLWFCLACLPKHADCMGLVMLPRGTHRYSEPGLEGDVWQVGGGWRWTVYDAEERVYEGGGQLKTEGEALAAMLKLLRKEGK